MKPFQALSPAKNLPIFFPTNYLPTKTNKASILFNYPLISSTNFKQHCTESQIVASLSDFHPMGSRNDPNENPTATSNPSSLPPERDYESGTTVDIPINNTKDLKAKEKELQDKEAELKRREEELKKREEAIAKSGVVIEENNWPPFYPIIHHDIKSEIPIHLQKVQYVAFGSWLGIIICLVWNLVAVSVAWLQGEGVTIWLCAVIYIILGIPGSYFLWYRPLYRATRSDSAVKFSFFLIAYSFHVCFCAFASLAPPIFIEGKSIAGILPAFDLLVGNAMLGGIYLIGFGLFFIETAISIWVIQQVYSYFRGSGKAAEMKREATRSTMMAAL